MSLGHCHAAEADPPARLHLGDLADVEGADRADLGVSTGGLPVGQQHDRLALTDDLDAAQRHAVGDDVVAVGMLDEGALEPRAHAVALGQHLVGPFEEGGDALRGEAIVLRSQHHRQLGLGPVAGHAIRVQAVRPRRPHRAQRQLVALAERAALEAPQPAAHVGRARAQHRRRLDAAGDRQVSADPAAGGSKAQHVPRAHPQALPGGRRRPVQSGRHVGAGDRDQALVRELHARPDEGELEPRRGIGIADQAVGEEEGLAVHGARSGDPYAKVARPAQVLDGGERTRVLDDQPAHDVVTGPAIRGAYRPASTSAAMASYSARSTGQNRTWSPARSRIGSAAVGS